MMPSRKLFSFFLSALILTVSCAANTVITKSAGSDEESLTLKRGETFSIKLDSQLSTGYSWKAVEISDKLILKKETVKTEESGKTGGIDIQEFVFSTKSSGKALILLKYGEHWKKNPEYIKTFKVNIEIK